MDELQTNRDFGRHETFREETIPHEPSNLDTESLSLIFDRTKRADTMYDVKADPECHWTVLRALST